AVQSRNGSWQPGGLLRQLLSRRPAGPLWQPRRLHDAPPGSGKRQGNPALPGAHALCVGRGGLSRRPPRPFRRRFPYGHPVGRRALSAGGYMMGTSGTPGPNGKVLAEPEMDKSVRLWDVETGKELRRFEGQTRMVTSVAFAPDGRSALTASADGSLRLWEIET